MTSTTPSPPTSVAACDNRLISPEAAAAVRAAEEFALTHDHSTLIPLLGTSDTFMSHEELLAMRAADTAEHE